MKKELIIEQIKNGNYTIEIEKECGCAFDWKIENMCGGQQLNPNVYSDCCWVGTVLRITEEPIYERIAYEGSRSLDEITENELKELFEELGKDLTEEMTFNEDRETNEEHDIREREALIEFIDDNNYKCFIKYPRNFANEYDCILVAENADQEYIPEKAEEVSPEQFVDKFLRKDNALTEFVIGFEFIE